MPPFRPTGLIAALHCIDQAAERTLISRLADHRSGNVANVAAPACRKQRQADQGRKSRTAMCIRKASDLPWPPDAHCAPQDALHVIRDILELGASAGQHDLAPYGTGEAQSLE